MKVKGVEPIPLSYPDANDERGLGHLVLVRMDTDDGLVGWGRPGRGSPRRAWPPARCCAGSASC